MRTVSRSRPIFWSTLTATPWPSLIRPRSKCSVPTKLWLNRSASLRANASTCCARGVKLFMASSLISLFYKCMMRRDCPASRDPPTGQLPRQALSELSYSYLFNVNANREIRQRFFVAVAVEQNAFDLAQDFDGRELGRSQTDGFAETGEGRPPHSLSQFALGLSPPGAGKGRALQLAEVRRKCLAPENFFENLAHFGSVFAAGIQRLGAGPLAVRSNDFV